MTGRSLNPSDENKLTSSYLLRYFLLSLFLLLKFLWFYHNKTTTYHHSE